MALADLKSTKFSNKSKLHFSFALIPRKRQVVSWGDQLNIPIHYVHDLPVEFRGTLGKPHSGFHKGHPPAKALSGSGIHDGDLLAKAYSASVWTPPLSDAYSASLWTPLLCVRQVIAHRLGVHEGDTLGKPHSGVHDGDMLAKAHSASVWNPPLSVRQVIAHRLGVHEGDTLGKPHSGVHDGDLLAEALSGSGVDDGDLLAERASLWAPRDRLALAHIPFLDGLSFSLRAGPLLATTLSNQGESSGSGGGAGEERNGGGGDGNQGIGGGVGGGGHREGSGTEQRGSRGRSHGGGNGDDDDNDHGGQFGYILNEGRQRLVRMAEILLPFNFQVFATVESFDITGLSVRVRSVRVVSLGFTSVALVCLSASIRQRGTNPRLASILSWIGSVATFLGFISMIAMALSASFIP